MCARAPAQPDADWLLRLSIREKRVVGIATTKRWVLECILAAHWVFVSRVTPTKYRTHKLDLKDVALCDEIKQRVGKVRSLITFVHALL